MDTDRVRVDEKHRLPLRLAAVALGYVAYRLVEATDFAGALLVGFGIWLTGVSQVERAMSSDTAVLRSVRGRPAKRLRRIQAIGTCAGLALIVVGLALVVL